MIEIGLRPAACARAACMSILLAVALEVAAQPSAEPGLVKHGATVRVAAHTFVIPDGDVSFVPNVGIVVGERGTLIVDTGLGERNGRTVLEEARKVAASSEFYVTATHFHPEHDLGATAFPTTAKMVRWDAQQREADELGPDMIKRFAGFSPALAELLRGARFRAPDIEFEDEITIDLGGVSVRAFGVGPNHTRGDTAFFVVEDGVLFTGDTVMSVFPAVNAQAADIGKWLANLDRYEALQPKRIVPAHGRMGDLAFVRRYREYFTAVTTRVRQAKARGLSVEQAEKSLAGELAQQFSDLNPVNGPATGRINAAIQAAYRQGPQGAPR
jgi:glyoxylase-like metal-dependent hydrolase (beta-lactamase superfamily II)